MFKKYTLTLSGLIISIFCFAQPGQLIVPKYLRLPVDSVQCKQLINSLNGFLYQTAKVNKDNSFVLKECLSETSILMDEIKGMENGEGLGKKSIYKCYLTNVTLLDSADYLVQFSYIGVADSVPVLRASFNLQAKKGDGRFYFYSPFKKNAAGWEVKIDGEFSLYYNTAVDFAKTNEYIKKAREFDKKLHAPAYKTRIYFCGNLPHALDLLGVQYKSDYNGISSDNLSSFEDGVDLDIIGANPDDPSVLDLHDLWHDRLHHVISKTIINKPVDEGCAYLYGGSWGISWADIFKRFKVFMGGNRDWLTAFNENKNFGDSQRYHLYTSYVINALITQQLEKEKGFPTVMELLSCGKKESDNANYFTALNRLSGITKDNFNERVQALVDKESAK